MKQIFIIFLILMLMTLANTIVVSCSSLCQTKVGSGSNCNCTLCALYSSTINTPSYCNCNPGYSLNTSSGTCFRCDTSCLSCSGPQINQCLTCHTFFIYSKIASTCTAPNNRTYTTLEVSFYFDNFIILPTWVIMNSTNKPMIYNGSGTTICSGISILGGTGLLGSGDYLQRIYTSLTPHYSIRIMMAYYFLNLDSVVGNGNVKLDTQTKSFTVPTNMSEFPVDAIQGKFYEYFFDQIFTHSASNATVTISTDILTTYGIRQFIIITLNCNTTYCKTCDGGTAQNCLSCTDPNRIPIFNNTNGTGKSGTCLCTPPYYAQPKQGICSLPCPLTPITYYGYNFTCVLNCPQTTPDYISQNYYASDVDYTCVKICPTISVDGNPLYYDNTSYKCVSNCPINQPYANPLNRICYTQCPDGLYNHDVTMTCLDYCYSILNSSQVILNWNYTLWRYSPTFNGKNGVCVSKCPSGSWANPITLTCESTCTRDATVLFLNDTSTGINRCIQKCPAPDWFGDPFVLACTTTCSEGYFGDPSTPNRTCVAKCSSSSTVPYGYIYINGISLCVSQCLDGTWGQPSTNLCVLTTLQCDPLFADDVKHLCVIPTDCSLNYFADPTTFSCKMICPSPYFGNPYTKTCQLNCVSPYFADIGNNLCLTNCFSNNTFADPSNPLNRSCTTICNNSAGNYPFAQPFSNTCVKTCVQPGYFADNQTTPTWACVKRCSKTPKISYADQTTQVCVQFCPSSPDLYFADNSTGTGVCVLICPKYPPLFGDSSNGWGVCTKLCPNISSGSLYGDPINNRYCVAETQCPMGYFAQGFLNLCVNKCNDTTYGYNSFNITHYANAKGAYCEITPKDCGSGYFADDSTNLCVPQCPASQGTFGDPITNKCVLKCPIDQNDIIYYADPVSRKCITNCLDPYFGENSTQTCVETCLPANSFADIQANQNSNRICVQICSLQPFYLFADPFLKTCVNSTDCPTNYYGQNLTSTCVNKCPITLTPLTYTYAYTNSTVKLCMAICPVPQFGDITLGYGRCVTNCPTVPPRYANPVNQLCVAVCNSSYYADNTTQSCVQVCPSGYFAYDPTRQCVKVCPKGYYSDTTNPPVCHSKYSDCPTNTFGDDYTTSCNSICTGPNPISEFGYNKYCYLKCPGGPGRFAYSGTRLCVETCPNVTVSSSTTIYYGDPTTYQCVLSCKSPLLWADFQLNLCVSICSADYPTYSQNYNHKCVISLDCPKIPVYYYGDNNTRSCVTKCVLNSSMVEYAQNSTRTCVSKCFVVNDSIVFYGDNSTGAPICVAVCPTVPILFGQNITNLCVSQCPPSTYGDQSTIGTRACVSVCPKQLSIQYYSQDYLNLCVSTCVIGTWANPQNINGPHCETLPTSCEPNYADNSTTSCVPTCPSTMGYYGDPTTQLCVLLCANTTIQYFADQSTRLCVQNCPSPTFANNATGDCEYFCTTPGTYGDSRSELIYNTYRYCVTSCDGRGDRVAFTDSTTGLCVLTCPATYSLFGDNVTGSCVSVCVNHSTTAYFADVYFNRQCVKTCTGSQFYQFNPNLCVSICSQVLNQFGDPNNGSVCVGQSSCSNGYFTYSGNDISGNNYIRMCVQFCNDYGNFQYNGHCVQICPSGYYAKPNGNCVPVSNCNPLFADNSTTSCVSVCTFGFADPITHYCIAVCNSSAGYYGSGNVCLTNCPSNSYPDNKTSRCISTCPINKFLALTTSNGCSSTCQTGYADSSSWTCTNTCSGMTVGDPSTHTCVNTCPSKSYILDGICVKSCSAPTPYSDNITNKCVNLCSKGTWGYIDACVPNCTNACIGTCTTTKNLGCVSLCADITCVSVCINNCDCQGDSLCLSNCTSACNQNCTSKQNVCINLCEEQGLIDCTTQCFTPSNAYGQYTNGAERFCYTVNNIINSFLTTYFLDQVNQIWVEFCPTNPLTFADPNTQLCTSVCSKPSSNYYYSDPQTGFCATFCSNSSYYADPSTRSCVLSCPSSASLFADAQDTIQKCNIQCTQSSIPYYADNATRSCVSLCPDNTYGYKINYTCLQSCPSSYFIDPINQICIQSCNDIGLVGHHYYADSTTGQCVEFCNNSYSSLDNYQCVTACPGPVYLNADNSTNTCVIQCPANPDYYADNKKCVLNCSDGFADNTTRKCVSTCPGGSFGEPLSKKCVQACLPGYFGDSGNNLCIDSSSTSFCTNGLFKDSATGLCVTKCSAGTYSDTLTYTCQNICSGNQYAQNISDAGVCQSLCIDGTFSDPLSKTCVSICPSFGYSFGMAVINQCVSVCNTTTGFFADNFTRKCTSNCSISNTFGDPITFTCVMLCTKGYFMQNSTNLCQPVCSTGFADPVSQSCVLKCPSLPQMYGFSFVCYYNCSNAVGTYADNITNLCSSSCSGQNYYADNTTKTCVKYCADGSFATNISSIGVCVKTCSIGTFGDNFTRSCVQTCPASQSTFADQNSQLCVSICPNGFFAQNSTQKCVAICPTIPVITWADSYSKYCVTKCAYPTQYGDNITGTCVNTCSSTTFSDYVTQSCVSVCFSVNTIIRFADSTTNACVFTCPKGYFGDTINFICAENCPANYYRDDSTQLCVLVCPSSPDFFADSTTQNCVSQCPNTYFASNNVDRVCTQDCNQYSGAFADPTHNRCVQTCATTPYLYSTNSTHQCVSLCPQSQFGDNYTQRCVTQCPLVSAFQNYQTYSYSNSTYRQCVRFCPVGYYAQNITFTCVPTCTSSYADSITGYCVSNCSVQPFYYRDSILKKCSATCTTPNIYKLNTDQTCVSECPTSPQYFADSQSSSCVLFCPVNTYGDPNIVPPSCQNSCSNSKFADPILRLCVDACTSTPIFYADPSTYTCVQYCPNNYFSDDSTKSCVNLCPNLPTPTFADTNTNKCVIGCQYPYFASIIPNNVCILICTVGWYADSISRSCVQLCPSGYYADDSNRQCVTICNITLGLYANTTDSNQRICVSSCQPLYRDNSTQKCVSKCPASPSYFADNSTFSCVKNCAVGHFADPSSRVCVLTCAVHTYADSSTGRCVEQCPINQYNIQTYADPLSRACQNLCSPDYYASNLTLKCVLTCPTSPIIYFAYSQNASCLSSCPSPFFADQTRSLCVLDCLGTIPTSFADSESGVCTTLCPLNTYGDPTSATCVPKCLNPWLADPSTRLCVEKCPSIQGTYADYLRDQKCVTLCPPLTFANPATSKCQSNCTSGYNFPLNNTCVSACPTPYFANKTISLCTLTCEIGYYGSLLNNVCQLCSLTCTSCNESTNCLNCKTDYYLSFGACVKTCMFGGAVFNYANIYSMTCVTASNCPAGTYGLNSTINCTNISNDLTLYANQTTKRWEKCPTGCSSCVNSTICVTCTSSYFLNPTKMCQSYCNPDGINIYYYLSSCVKTCPNGSYLSNDLITCQICSSICSTCNITATNCTSCSNSYLYNSTCLSECPSNYYSKNNICQKCQKGISNCQTPLTFNVVTTIVNYKYVLIVVFSEDVKINTTNLLKQLKVILKSTGRLLQSSLADMINNGIQYTYTIDSKNNLYLTLTSLDANLVNPVFNVAFQNPTVVISKKDGNPLQKLTAPVQLALGSTFPTTGKVGNLSIDITTDSTLAIILCAILFVFFFISLVCAPFGFHLTIEAFQIFFFHAYINYTLPPNLFYFLKNLKISTLNFLPNILAKPDDSSWNMLIPTVIYNVDGDISFGLSCGSIIFYLLVYLFFASLIWSLTTRVVGNRSLRNLITDIYNKRVKFGFLNEILWVYGLPVAFYAMIQMKHYNAATAMYGFNIFLSFLFLVAYLTLVFIFLRKIYQNRENIIQMQDLDNYVPFFHSIKETNPNTFINFIYYARKTLLCVFIVGAYDNPKAQLILLIILNFTLFILLIVMRPYKEVLANILHILNQFSIIAFEISLLVYICNMYNALLVSKIMFGKIWQYLITVHLCILILWGIFKLYISYGSIKEQLLSSEFYKLYFDDSVEKQIEDGLMQMEKIDKQGLIQAVSIDTFDDEVVKLRIKRKRKVVKGEKPKERRQRNDEEYEKIDMDQTYDIKKITKVAEEKLGVRKQKTRNNNVFDSEMQEPLGIAKKDEQYDKMEELDYKKINPQLMDGLSQVSEEKSFEKQQRKEQKQVIQVQPIHTIINQDGEKLYTEIKPKKQYISVQKANFGSENIGKQTKILQKKEVQDDVIINFDEVMSQKNSKAKDLYDILYQPSEQQIQVVTKNRQESEPNENFFPLDTDKTLRNAQHEQAKAIQNIIEENEEQIILQKSKEVLILKQDNKKDREHFTNQQQLRQQQQDFNFFMMGDQVHKNIKEQKKKRQTEKTKAKPKPQIQIQNLEEEKQVSYERLQTPHSEFHAIQVNEEQQYGFQQSITKVKAEKPLVQDFVPRSKNNGDVQPLRAIETGSQNEYIPTKQNEPLITYNKVEDQQQVIKFEEHQEPQVYVPMNSQEKKLKNEQKRLKTEQRGFKKLQFTEDQFQESNKIIQKQKEQIPKYPSKTITRNIPIQTQHKTNKANYEVFESEASYRKPIDQIAEMPGHNEQIEEQFKIESTGKKSKKKKNKKGKTKQEVEQQYQNPFNNIEQEKIIPVDTTQKHIQPPKNKKVQQKFEYIQMDNKNNSLGYHQLQTPVSVKDNTISKNIEEPNILLISNKKQESEYIQMDTIHKTEQKNKQQVDKEGYLQLQTPASLKQETIEKPKRKKKAGTKLEEEEKLYEDDEGYIQMKKEQLNKQKEKKTFDAAQFNQQQYKEVKKQNNQNIWQEDYEQEINQGNIDQDWAPVQQLNTENNKKANFQDLVDDDILMNDEALDRYLEKENKKEKKLNYLFQDQEES